MKKTWFISDLHLDPSRPEIFTLLHEFLDDIEHQAEALYILGDLFEFWVGDDITNSPLGLPFMPVLEHLKRLSDSGIKLYFIQGNRDFLVRDTFINLIGATLLPDTQVIDLYGTPTLILHGDTLCIDDKNYQRMRTLFRIKFIQSLYLSLSIKNRVNRAQGVRKVTSKQVQEKRYEILGVNQQAVETAMRENNVTQMIHGHTHRPAIHEFDLEGEKAQRMVLGDWHDKASFIVASENSIELVS
ncbi:MAG: UDP-2,3-diacylglucosamine diphosphatase [Thiotrichaceae bacterium]